MRREQPLVQARPVIIAVEVRVLEREVREGMRAVNDDFDAALAPHLAYALYGKYLPGEIRDVAKCITRVRGVIARSKIWKR